MIAFSLETLLQTSLQTLDEQLRPLAGWLGTFALHSTIALGFTCLFVRMRRQRSLGLQDMLLRQALWLPLLSATLQYAFFGSMWDGLMAQPVVTVDELAPLASMLSEAEAEASMVAVETIHRGGHRGCLFAARLHLVVAHVASLVAPARDALPRNRRPRFVIGSDDGDASGAAAIPAHQSRARLEHSDRLWLLAT